MHICMQVNHSNGSDETSIRVDCIDLEAHYKCKSIRQVLMANLLVCFGRVTHVKNARDFSNYLSTMMSFGVH